MSAPYQTGVCGCGNAGIVVRMSDRLWTEFFSVDGVERPQTVAGCVMCLVDWERFAGPLEYLKAPTS